MKNISLIINVILLAAVAVLFVLVLGNKNQQQAGETYVINDSIASSFTLPIAYINVDSLLLNYQFAREANEVLIKKEEDSRLTFNTKARQLQNEVAEFQSKLENNAFLSRERAEREQTRLVQKQQELQELEAKLAQELFAQQQKVNEQLRDTIDNFLQQYNKNKKYEIILSNTGNDNILHANKKYDITKDVIEQLNKRLGKK
ncbi:OmpH family outer membrane protein [Paludibacter sp. 221]|uniref:OmpH family outer membrane protein n=1 Tax=Paludibacter sp. 221 TaxID=2302939 RepID=UPI0013D30B77|nr:OmpH family outer membrane protein [Paludibacter sp. 221]NDV47603.1 OmpH family outer membrane protein [Paludibacter sp. 221]